MASDMKSGSPPERILGIETSSPIFSVAVSEGDRILSSLDGGGQGKPSTLLAGLIQEGLKKAGLRLDDLDGFAVSIGPGSFTGLRVGVMTVKTLAWALKKPVLPISSLEVIAANLVSGQGPIGLFLDARKGKVYAACFKSNGAGVLERLSEDQLLTPEEALRRFPPQTLLMGDGLKRYGPLIASEEGKGFSLAPEAHWVPSARELCRIAASRWPTGVVDDPHPLVPEYLYSKESDITGW